MKEARNKKVYSVRFHLYEDLDQVKLSMVIDIRTGAAFSRTGRFSGKRHERTFWGDVNVQYLDRCICLYLLNCTFRISIIHDILFNNEK